MRLASKETREIWHDDTTSEANTHKFTVVSFFSGCGGLDLGFEGDFEFRSHLYRKLPFKILKAYELDPRCKVTYEKNLSSTLEVCDLAKADVGKMPAADVLIGGFPCQEYSLCGPLGGTNSKRGSLFKAMSRYAKRWKPSIVVLENVPNLKNINKGEDFRQVLRSFAYAGYRAIPWNLYAPDYGVPQTRKRLVIVFVRKDILGEPTFPKKNGNQSAPTVSWAIGDLIGVLDESVPNQSQFFKAALAKRGHGQGDEISPKNEPGYTVRANARSRVQFHYSLPRRLTVRECARLQTFPDDFVFPYTATRNIFQIGNAVPPVLAHAVAESVAKFLQSGQCTQEIKL